MTRARRPAPRRRAGPRPAGTGISAVVSDLQKGWWALGVAGLVVGTLGFQALPPSRRLEAVERATQRQDSVNVRQDSAWSAESRVVRAALDSINRQLGQLRAGQCVKERDGMARLLYGCGAR